MSKLFLKTLLLIMFLFLMNGVLVYGDDSVLGVFWERRPDFLWIANKQSDEGDIEETKLGMEEVEDVEDLFNGDDYQVIFTASKKDRKKIKKYAKKLNQKITIIGQIINNNKRNILLKDGRPLKMSNFKGYKHTF